MQDVNGLAEQASVVRHWLELYPADAPVVVVPVFNAYQDALECVESLLTSVPRDTPILVLDDASTDERVATLAHSLRDSGQGYVRKPTNSGFVGTVNLAFEWCAPRDVVVINSDVVVPPCWLERLKGAACASSTTATATPFTNNGTIVSVPHRNRPMADLLPGLTVGEADARICAASRKLRPLIPTAVGHCTYFRRQALDTIGYFDEAFAPGYGEEVDLCQRAIASGFSHVVADDLFVYHKGSRSFDSQNREAKLRLQHEHERAIDRRYPWYRQWIEQTEQDTKSPLAQAIERARTALLGFHIAIDATRVDGSTAGTQVLTLELVHALATSPARFGTLTLIIADGVPNKALLGVQQLVDEIIPASRLQDANEPRFDLVHRPGQVFSPAVLNLLQEVAGRFVISQLDCISFSTPGYSPSPETWRQLQELTRAAFASADGVAFLSNSGLQEACELGLSVPMERTCVTFTGVDHQLHAAEPVAPTNSRGFAGRPFILMLGTNFKHKNRAYALRILRLLISEHGWTGDLVLAGPNVGAGGSEAEEKRVLSESTELRGRVHYLGPVTEAGKAWLLQNASLVLYPSIREGFGMVPFEAASVGTPTLSSRLSSLAEILGDEVAYLSLRSARADADIVWRLCVDRVAADRQIRAIRTRAENFTWQHTAERTWHFYRQVLDMPPRSSHSGSPAARQPQQRERFQSASLTAPSAWLRRSKRATQALRKGGIGALWQEVRQFTQWISMRAGQ
jgi:GT2 family glycosyltransferase/glycosyltransferase involved in cell wall biosynthesis